MKTVLVTEALHPVFYDRMHTAGVATELLAEGADVQQLINSMRSVQGLALRGRFRIGAELMDKAPSLQVIGRAGSGLELIDLEAARQRNIICLNSPEGNCDSVAEHAIGMLLLLMHQLRKADAELRQGIFNRNGNWGNELKGKTVGIIGLGHTGGALARKLQNWGLTLLAVDPYRTEPWPSYVQQVEMHELQARADVLSFHVPLTDETRGMISRQWLQQLQRRPIVVNAARGGLAKTADLADALQQNWIGGLCLDTFEEEALGFEALSFQSPDLQRLSAHPQVVMTPHVAGWSQQSWEGISAVLADKMLKVLLD
jgi:D-3-phosphoglycerate dehydrogenase